MFLLYDLMLLAVALVLLPYYLLARLVGGKNRRALRERLGFFRPGRLQALAGRPLIWIHAVSVGETRAAIPLLQALKQRYPGHALVLTNVTETGHAVAATIPELDLCLFFPFDLSWVIRRVLRQLRPRLIVIVETEIWPNLVRHAGASGIPVVLVNGRISDRSFPRYRRLRRLLVPVLDRIAAFCMQSLQDAERIRLMGAPAGRISVTGNLKFDMPASLMPEEGRAHLRQRFRLPAEVPVWVAGSTHAGEEEVVLAVYEQLLQQGQELVLGLVPRHPNRCDAVAELLQKNRLGFRRRSTLDPAGPLLESGEVLLVDTLGELLALYAAADLVFVGGSLVPVGGHNVLEAALVGRAVIFGPHMHNFREISRMVQEQGAGFQVTGLQQLADTVLRLLTDRNAAVVAGAAGQALVRQNMGTTGNTMQVIEGLLRSSR